MSVLDTLTISISISISHDINCTKASIDQESLLKEPKPTEYNWPSYSKASYYYKTMFWYFWS